jgi:hypothetical protein
MSAAKRELFEGLGLSALALFFTTMLLIASFVAIRDAQWLRAVLFGLPGLFALYWGIRFMLAQFAAYEADKAGQR